MLKQVTARDLAAEALRRAVLEHLFYSVGKDPEHAVRRDWCVALSLAVRDRVVDRWVASTRRTYADDRKRVYYLSMEFLIGRLLSGTIANLGLLDSCRSVMSDLGQDYDAVVAEEPDAALGNGGLGRLAACFLDSMSSLGIPAYGYGLRYEHGLFKQRFEEGWQLEEAEDWLTRAHPWEFERPEVTYPIGFGGQVVPGPDGAPIWQPGESVLAAAFDTPVAGWRGRHVNTLRLWAAKPATIFDLKSFNSGDYLRAATPQVLAETITRVLYPDDATPQGQELRLRQEYFFTAASIQDLVRRFLQTHGDIRKLPDYAAIQLNDTHPAIAVPELLRLLMDDHHMPLEAAFDVTRRTLSYTNHTLLPEALERWPVDLIERLLPRHMQIIRQLDAGPVEAALSASGDVQRDAVRIIGHGARPNVRMGNLAFLGSHRVNGVSALHTELMKETVFRDLNALYPDRIVNETNGITPRRWLHMSNQPLSHLITDAIGDAWVGDLEKLEALRPMADDSGFRAAFARARRQNKERLAAEIAHRVGLRVDPDAMFDLQIKRIHEYKRQLLNVLEIVALYNAIRNEPAADWQPRVKIFAGKAAPGYHMAKLIIKLANDVAQVVNNDPVVGDRLKVCFLPNYNVSLAEILIPAADLSEQISTAGMEASGTGNMKFALNGALTVGTLDGANVEIRERVGDENIYIFGLHAHDVAARRAAGNDSRSIIEADDRLREVLKQIYSGVFSPDMPHRFHGVLGQLYDNDWFMVTPDFAPYYEIQRRIDRDFHDTDAWMRRAILNTAKVGWFSADRTIRGYAQDVWGVPVVEWPASTAPQAAA